jgi:alpha-glucuronidase
MDQLHHTDVAAKVPARDGRPRWCVLLASAALLLTNACSSDRAPGSPGAGGTTGLVTSGTGGLAGNGGNAGGASGASGASGAAGALAGGGGGAVGSGGQSTGGALGSDEEYPLPTDLGAETGSDLWLRYPLVPIPGRLAEYRGAFTHVVGAASATLGIASAELVKGLSGLTGTSVTAATAPAGAGAVVIGTPASSPLIAGSALASRLASLGPEGYLVESVLLEGQTTIVVAGNTELGVLYGSFALLRHLQSHSSIAALSLSASPKIQHRILNHWDNLDRTVERGYAGQSLWNWGALPATLSPRYTDYARANASLGINGTVLTNVNADAQVLNASYLAKVKALADLLRPYGIRVYLTARFNAPMILGGLGTADPLNAGVQQWWESKVDEIYAAIPDFGGFLVKANSEGQPGPQEYGRSHVQGANLLAAALAPHGGIVMWRAFVYSEDSPDDRIKQAYDEFEPFDGQFADNVLVQVKNGPLDFQPREPFHPLFGSMPNTPLALELQITKEYLGQDTHLAYLGTQWQEVLRAETAQGPASSVARVVDGSLHDYDTTVIAGVANVGEDANWTGSHFNQANWYAFGRMAWDPDADAQNVAEEWVRQTFSNDPLVVEPVTAMMMASRQALVDYMTPLGLVHIMGTDHHYGPAPWVNDLSRAEWNPFYYHKANQQGVGFDRSASGSNAVEQYADAVAAKFGNRESVPDDYLLFFHRVGWQETLGSGRTLWDELVYRYSRGVDDVGKMRTAWEGVSARIDSQRFNEVQRFLEIQHYEARWWRDACLSYFGQVASLSVPSAYSPPASSLSTYQGLDCPPDVKKPRCNAIYTGQPSPAILP